ncbi:DUF1289 domain-containing protein [Gilliamella sp. Pra-s65]|uniref:DUF1289 domain-containing protein n=1 Tax=unclassified Gilliamella TaxID=2685620 RepID=UPI001325D08E|nr:MULTISPECIES: DUF1289 domain-containing protein [unclassified Gilliamella]MWN31113.1 DUF1289 domain-containing protein [Gilliamella sp. Pra-s60]MWN89848.1 DUF1289 domain-containing protein [Gilliamella sp. Pra-s65]MWP28322.1 DUF1289 domain-containing protein [Gilliamella sp. Pra-s54]MWP73020.1 DUF1289 domain-containing protein [Gilliamella sp. Pra-s52]
MDQIEFFDIPSPCKRICETDKQGYCVACYRSRQERFNWLTFNDSQKKEVLRLCKQRALKRHYLLLQQQRQKLNSIPLQIELNF